MGAITADPTRTLSPATSEAIAVVKLRLAEAENEERELARLPEMRMQRRLARQEVRELKKRAAILALGFEPFLPAKDWYAGFLSQPFGLFQRAYLGLEFPLYRRPLPLTALAAYREARGLFDLFSVHSPERHVFTPIRRKADPVLVGWAMRQGRSRDSLVFRLLDRVSLGLPLALQEISALADSYLIAQWDLEVGQ